MCGAPIFSQHLLNLYISMPLMLLVIGFGLVFPMVFATQSIKTVSSHVLGPLAQTKAVPGISLVINLFLSFLTAILFLALSMAMLWLSTVMNSTRSNL